MTWTSASTCCCKGSLASLIACDLLMLPASQALRTGGVALLEMTAFLLRVDTEAAGCWLAGAGGTLVSDSRPTALAPTRLGGGAPTGARLWELVREDCFLLLTEP